MATRADRLNERLRGAQRTNLDDDDTFGFDIPGVAAPPPKETDAPIAQRSSSSPKRRRLNEPEPSSANPRAAIPPSSQRRPRRSPSVRAPSVPSIQEEIEGAGGAAARSVRNTTASSSSRHTSSPARTLAIEPAILEEDEFEAQPEPPSTQSPRTRRATQQVVEEEVEESPRDAPGSGRRRRIESVGASASSARLQEFLGSDGSTAFSSSPLAKVARRSTAANARRVTPSAPTRLSRQQNQQESSPERQESAEQEEAEEVDAVEAAQVIGRKRPAQDASRLSPVLGSGSPEPDEAEKDEGPAPKRQRGRPRKSLEPGSQEPERGGTAEKPKRGRGRPSKSPTTKNGPAAALRGQDSERETSNTPKRRPGRPSKSPAVQRQPTQKAKQARPSQPQAAASRASKPKAATKPRKRAVERSRPAEAENESEGEEGEDVSIEITVQRYVNTKSRDDFDEEDPLHMEIPFANRTGESAVDVLSQVCQEVMERTLGQLHELLSATEEPAKKKEYRIKMRAIDAYKEELSARLLQHVSPSFNPVF